jgi:hypothetical protein
MSVVFQNIDPPPPHRPASVYPPAFGAGGGHTRWVERGVGVQYFERRQTQLCTLHMQVFCGTMYVNRFLKLFLMIPCVFILLRG